MKIYLFLLIAGASANNTPAIGGALTFNVNNTPSDTWWNNGSASLLDIYIRKHTKMYPTILTPW